MTTRKKPFVSGGYYHIYNRGVDKREIFSDRTDFERFLQSMAEFNTATPIGSLYQNSFRKKLTLSGETAKCGDKDEEEKLVKIVAYCLNRNHFHFLLEQNREGGISEFMKRLLGGYTWYYNHKHERTGALFQGVFKSVQIDSNDYLLHVSAYINLNYRVHGAQKAEDSIFTKHRSSWPEYRTGKTMIASPESILEQFSRGDYEIFAKNSLVGTLERRTKPELPENMLLEDL